MQQWVYDVISLRPSELFLFSGKLTGMHELSAQITTAQSLKMATVCQRVLECVNMTEVVSSANDQALFAGLSMSGHVVCLLSLLHSTPTVVGLSVNSENALLNSMIVKLLKAEIAKL